MISATTAPDTWRHIHLGEDGKTIVQVCLCEHGGIHVSIGPDGGSGTTEGAEAALSVVEAMWLSRALGKYISQSMASDPNVDIDYCLEEIEADARFLEAVEIDGELHACSSVKAAGAAGA